MTFVSASNTIRWLSVRNDSSEDAPAFGVMRITGVTTLEGQAVLTVDKPNADGGTFYVFNGPFKIAAGSYGSCTCDFPCFAAYDDADTPANKQEWGAKSGQWTLKKGRTGYYTIGNPISGRVEIELSLTSTTPLYHFALTAALANGSSATATIREWTGAAWASTGASITVYDFCSISPGSNSGKFGTAWLNPDSGRYEVLELPQSGNTNIVWCKAESLWSNATGNDSTVFCYLVTDRGGLTTILDGVGAPIPATVYLPRPSKMMDPNVSVGKTIAAEVDNNGIYVCVSDYLDDAIGTVKMWVGNESDVGEGWRIYSTAEGRFPVGVTSSDPDIPATAPGVTGGTKKHKHPEAGDATV